MTRNTDIKEILFPVELSNIYQYHEKPESQLPLFEFEEREEEKDLSKIHGYKAIINPKTGQVFFGCDRWVSFGYESRSPGPCQTMFPAIV